MSRASTIKKSLFAVVLLFTATHGLAQPTNATGKVNDYGMYRTTQLIPQNLVKTPESIVGLDKTPGRGVHLISITNRIPAKLGVHFGMRFTLLNLPVPDGVVGITKIARHPLMVKSDGTVSTCYTNVQKQIVRAGWTAGWTGYSFDHDYELLPGPWEFELQYEGKLLCKSEFIVFKE
jgi:hypothetical protein